MRVPRTLTGATTYLERFAEVDAELAEIEAVRNNAIVAANLEADQAGQALLAERAGLVGALGAWWPDAAAGLTLGKRKSIELGGCEIGSVKGRATLALAGDEGVVIAAMQALRWAKPLLRVKVSLDKTAILKTLDSPRAAALGELGFSRNDGEEAFFVRRLVQAGTLGSA